MRTRHDAHIIVSMPHGDSDATLERAVRSVLDSTYEALTLIVTNDGRDPDVAWRAIAHIDDSRLVRFDQPINRGRYYADAVTLLAAQQLGIEMWMVHDSDDWSDTWHITRLARTIRDADAAFSGYVRHKINTPKHVTRRYLAGRARMLKHATHYGASLWRTDSLLRIGGPNPEWRIAWDTMMISLTATYLRHNVTQVMGYHYQLRAGSLATSGGTGMKSTAREEAHAARAAIMSRVRSADSDEERLAAVAPSPEYANLVAVDADRLVRQILG